jgi:plasmid rolling circle replication initiator protein Rep
VNDIVPPKDKKPPLESYKEKKKEAEKISHLYTYSEKKHSRINDCSVTLWRETWEHTATQEKKELFSSNNCQLRFCPVCSWRKALKSSAIAYSNLSKMENLNFLILTLTLKNCDILDLKTTIKHMSESFHRLKKNTQWIKNVKGYIRAFECTVGDDGKMHPHFHVLLQVVPSYGKNKSRGYYISHEEFIDLWQNALKVDYKPSIRITKVKPKKKFKNPLAGSVCEIIKYTFKSSDLSKLNEHTFPILDLSMKGIKTINCGGSLLHSLKLSKNDDMSQDDWIMLARELFNWENGNYILSGKKF